MYVHILHRYNIDYKNEDLLIAKDINHFTPIMTAIAHGHKSVVRVFLENGCRADVTVRHQKTLLEWAIENGYNVLIEVSTSLMSTFT